MNNYERVKKELWSRRENIIQGKVNCIPFGFNRFEEIVPGVQQGKYTLVTASTKVGKTKITDNMYMYNPIKWKLNNPENPITLKIIYFTLEMSENQKITQAISNRLYRSSKGKIRIDPVNLRSTRNAIDDEILKLIDQEDDYFEYFNKTVTFIDNIKHAYGIFKYMDDYAKANGTIHYKDVEFTNHENGEKIKHTIFDRYEPDRPDEYVIVIVDHVSLLHPSKGNTLHQEISDLSSKYFVQLRNRYNYSPVIVQQQSAASESLDNMKANKLKPSLVDIADNKLTSRDVDLAIGLFSPFRHGIKQYPEKDGYNILKFRDRIRFLEVLASRDGGGNTICPLYFDGAVDYFMELPLPDETNKISEIYRKFLN